MWSTKGEHTLRGEGAITREGNDTAFSITRSYNDLLYSVKTNNQIQENK